MICSILHDYFTTENVSTDYDGGHASIAKIIDLSVAIIEMDTQLFLSDFQSRITFILALFYTIPVNIGSLYLTETY